MHLGYSAGHPLFSRHLGILAQRFRGPWLLPVCLGSGLSTRRGVGRPGPFPLDFAFPVSLSQGTAPSRSVVTGGCWVCTARAHPRKGRNPWAFIGCLSMNPWPMSILKLLIL